MDEMQVLTKISLFSKNDFSPNPHHQPAFRPQFRGTLAVCIFHPRRQLGPKGLPSSAWHFRPPGEANRAKALADKKIARGMAPRYSRMDTGGFLGPA